MNYEQKYKEALERAKNYFKANQRIGELEENDILSDIFPELGESEDEKVIRDIKVVLESSATKFFKEEGKMPIWYDRAIAWLEKQSDVDNANKVEPKFKVYDWVVTDKGDTVQIGAVNNGYYTIYNGMDFNMSYVDKCWHRWTIEDAKDGDILSTSAGAFIYYDNNSGSSYLGCYCGINTLGELKTDVKRYYWTGKKVYPATKEQRDKLEKAMLKAGYKWDADKRELIKL